MRRVLIGLLVLILLLVGAATVWYFTRDTTPVENQLATATPLPESVIFGVDDSESTLDFTIELANNDVEGTFVISDGTLVLVPTDDGWQFQANLIIDGQSVETGSSFMNSLLVLAMQAEKYPYGVFTGITLDSFENPEEPQTVTLVGEIELSGVTNPQTAEVEILRDGQILTADATLTVDFADFGADFSTIGNTEMDVTLHIVASQALAPEEPFDVDEFTGTEESDIAPTAEQ